MGTAGSITLAAAALIAAPVPRSLELDPGTTLVLVEDHRAPLVTLRLELPVGGWSPWAQQHHAADAWALQFHDRAGEFSRRADELAVGIELTTGPRSSTLTLSALSEDLDAGVALIREMLHSRDFSPGVLKSWNRGRRLEQAARRNDPQYRAEAELASIFLAPDDPRQQAWREPRRTPVRIERLAETRDRMLRLPGRVVGLAGDLDESRARRVAANLLVGLDTGPGEAGLAPSFPAPPSRGPGETERRVTIPRLTQTYLYYATASSYLVDRDYPAFLLADSVLAGHFYSRLYVALRHRSGETYGVTSLDRGELVPAFYVVATFTRTANAQRLEDRLREALALFREEGIDEQECAAACGHLQGREAFRGQSPDRILAVRLWERRLGLPAGFWEQQASRACALSRDDVNRFIRHFFDPDRMVMVRVEAER